MKKTLSIVAIILCGIFGWSYAVQAASPYIFGSSQVGSSPQNGYYLKTDGTNSTWAPVSGGSSGAFASSSPWTTNYLVQVVDNSTLKSIATSSLGLLTTNVAEGTNLYWTNTRFDTRLAATTTLPNLTTLAGLSTVGTITTGTWNGSTIDTAHGGTGTTSPSGILYGDNGSTSHLNTVTIGANLTFSGGTLSATGGGSGSIATSSSETAGYLPYWTSTSATPATLGKIATSSVSNGTGISFTGTAGTLVGGTSLTITNSSPLSGLSTSYPLSFSNPTLSWVGLATTSQPASSNVLVSNGTNGIYGVATSTLTASSPLTGSFTQLGSGGSLGCQTASGSQAGCLSSADWTTFNGKLSSVTADYPITGSGTSGSHLALAFGTTTSNTWAGLQTFGNSSTTAASFTYASATTAYFGTAYIPSLGTAAGTFLAADASGKIIATTTPSGGSGTVTSVALTVPTGLSISGSPITTSGTLALSLTSGYVIPLTASTTDWNTAYLNRITSIGPTGQGQTGSTITLATSTSATNGLTSALTVVGSGNTLTYTPSLSGTLTVGGGGTGQTSFTSSQLLYGNGSAALSSVATSSLSVDSTLSVSGGSLAAQVGGSNATFGLNLGHANTWTALQTFANASTTQLSIDATTGRLYIPANSNPTIASTGDIGINTTAASSSIRYYDGSAERAVYPDEPRMLSVSSTTALAQNGAYVIGTTHVDIGNGTATTSNITCGTTGAWTSNSTSFNMGDNLVAEYFSTGTTTVHLMKVYHPMTITQLSCLVDSSGSPSWIQFSQEVRQDAD